MDNKRMKTDHNLIDRAHGTIEKALVKFLSGSIKNSWYLMRTEDSVNGASDTS